MSSCSECLAWKSPSRDRDFQGNVNRGECRKRPPVVVADTHGGWSNFSGGGSTSTTIGTVFPKTLPTDWCMESVTSTTHGVQQGGGEE